ncbi:MAG: cobaltochelatase subunit CobN [Desulfobulbaceae bacterium]|jgi:cobaltochelatase CobN|nr:cobaltochelatase subunit CobN [Desulfobulbaceae bacterium]
MRSSRTFLFILFLLLLPTTSLADAGQKEVVILTGVGDSLVVARTFKELRNLPLASRYRFASYTDRDIRAGKVPLGQIQNAAIIVADFMHQEIGEFLAANLGDRKPAIYSLRCAYLAEGLTKQGLIINKQTERYYSPPTRENVQNLILLTLADQGEEVSYDQPFTLPKAGIFHPDTKEIFSDYETYLAWYRQSGKFSADGFWVGIHTFSTSAVQGGGRLEAEIIHTLEKEGINVLPVFGRPPYHHSLQDFFLNGDNKPRVQAICGFGFRFLKGFPEETDRILRTLNAPVFIPLSTDPITIDQWQQSAQGTSPLRVASQLCVPEQSGGIEPTIVGGKSAARLKGTTDLVYDTVPMPENIDFLVGRIKAWHNLQQKPNNEKKIAILYWNHPPGKQNVGASYLNLFKSIATILPAMKEAGYQLAGKLPREEEIKKRILLSGRNVGSWAPGELDKLIAAGGVVRIPIKKYKGWFATLDPDFKESVVRQWGEVEHSDIMIKDQEIIIPLVDLGNIIVLPQPSRGFGEDADQLYHDPKVYPHHQYIAFYLWLKKEFKADAVISLGKHGTHEWLPGKQIGLSMTCPPEILSQDIPNIYPYIVDNVGEGIQAKRRGRGVIIDHLIPPLKKGGSYMEYRELTGAIDAYHNAQALDEALAGEKLKTVHQLIRKLALDKDLGLNELDDEAIEEVEHYILELQEKLIPYGLHTFGVSPEGAALDDLTGAICLASPEISQEDMKARLTASGKAETTSLLRALAGGYISPGKGNDPIRNPESIPTGRNFYGFNVDKVPSAEAFAQGRKLAETLINDYQEKNGTYPDKLGIILWSTETQRNEGVNESAALHLLGITPVWDKKGRVVDVSAIPGQVLGRPRIDVLLQCSGLYRDAFPKTIKLLDRAVRLAGSLSDVENFVAVHNRRIAQSLLDKGYSEDEARTLSQARVFGPMPGAYVHAMQELIPNSGTWESDDEIADVWMHHYSFAYGDKLWGRSLKSAYKQNLSDVKITMHSRSSNLYNMLDNDDMFAFLGGLSLAVKKQTGEYPDAMVANLQDGTVKVDDLAKSIGKALRTRYLNPKWIEGMKSEGYAGARQMDKFVEYLWGFQVTTPYAVDKSQWEQIHDVYIEDKYGLDLKEFFDKENPWAIQSMAARMLEADRKKYWQAPTEMKKNLARTYAMNVIEKGVACCEHTCNNPMLQQFTANIISLYGLLTPAQLDQFKLEVAKATGRTQQENEAQYQKTRESLAKTLTEIQKEESVKAKTEGKKLEGLEMVEEKAEKTQTTASGSEWWVMAIVIGLLAILLIGWKRKKI